MSDNKNYKSFNFNHLYQLRLQDDEEIISKAEIVYNAQHLVSKNHTLDSGIFGATLMNPTCDICYQHVEDCPGHFAIIQLPFPIVRAICLKDFKLLLPILCPVCSALLVPDAKKSLILDSVNRFDYIRKESGKFTKNGESSVVCPRCKHPVIPVRILQQEPQLRVCIISNNAPEQVSPVHMQVMLQNFNQLDEIGFNKNYHPKNFMTSIIPIIPNKLRPKTITSSESTLTSYYRVIIEELCTELAKLYKTITAFNRPVIMRGDIVNNFNKYYDKLMAYYLLITDMGPDKTREIELTLIEKRDRKHVDEHNALIGRFKDKEKSIFSKGIIASRVNISARSVLGGAVDSPVTSTNVPYHIATKLSMLYPVYQQNLKLMKQLMAAMSNTDIRRNINIPHVLGVQDGRTGRYTKINIKNALTRASTLKPGDKIAITLLNGDIVMQCRFPSVREESWTSFQVIKDNNTIITIPLPDCKMKAADFDGDEAQIYILSSHVTDIEALLLHSTYQQFIAYKDGNPAIWYDEDAPYGLSKIVPGATSYVYQNELHNPPIDVIKIVESFLPKDLRYKDSKTEIYDGKFLNGKTNVYNKELHKYMASLYGTEITEELMDNLIQLAYDLNRDHGNTLGFEMRIYGEEAKKKIRELVDKMYDEMCKVESSNIKHKDLIQVNITEKMKTDIKQILLKSALGTNIDNLGYTKERQDEYYQIVVLLDHIIVDGGRIKPVLAEGTRVCCAYPRDSVDPCAYGFVKNSYNGDISPIAHFYESKQQRLSLFIKGKGTAKQGYMSKKLCVTYGSNYADYNGMVVNNFKIISTQYGCCGLNPRLFVEQPLTDIGMKDSEFESKYKDDKRLIELHKSINSYRQIYSLFTTFTKSEVIKNVFAAGFNYVQLIINYAKKGRTPIKDVDQFVNKIYEIYCPEHFSEQYIKENLIEHEYFFRVMMYNYDIPKNIQDQLYDQFIWSLVDGGDPVGMKASIATSEPLTQASLHAIHHAGGGGVDEDKIVRPMGIARFEELLGGNKCKVSMVTIKLYEDDLESCKKFANEQETFYFNNIWTRFELGVCSSIPKKILDLHPDLHLENIDINSYFIKSIWNVTNISAYNIHVVEVIDKLMKNYEEIMFITGYVLNSSEFMAYIFFKPTTKIQQIEVLTEEWAMERSSTVIHGKYLKNCFVSENKNMPGHYIIEANEVSANSMSLQNLIFDERIDPRGCKTTNPEVYYKLFGVGEASTRQYEELIYTATNLSETSGLLMRHYKVLADATFMNGEAMYASRNNLRHEREIDTLRMVQFETAKDMIQQALRFGDIQPVGDPVSAAVFGELPSLGTGASKVDLYVQ